MCLMLGKYFSIFEVYLNEENNRYKFRKINIEQVDAFTVSVYNI